MKFSFYKKYSTHIVLSVLLLAMVGIFWFGIVPLKQVVYDKMRSTQEFYARQENQRKQVAQLPELKAQYDAVLQNEQLFDFLIPESGVVDFVKTLEGLADQTHVEMSITSQDNGQITELKKKPAKPATAAGKNDPDASSGGDTSKKKVIDILDDIPYDKYLRLRVEVKGQYEDIVAFLRKMETLPVGLDVIHIEMRKGEAEQSVGRAAGSGANPFSLLGSGIQEVVEAPSVNKDVYDAIFDVVVYIAK